MWILSFIWYVEFYEIQIIYKLLFLGTTEAYDGTGRWDFLHNGHFSFIPSLSVVYKPVSSQQTTKIWPPFDCVTKQFLIRFNQRIFVNSFHSFVEFLILELSAHHSIPLSSFLSQSSSMYMSLIFSNFMIYSNLCEFYHLYDILNVMKFNLFVNYCS